MNNKVKFSILRDGTIKAATGSFADADHLKADQMMAWVSQKAGGQIIITTNTESRPDHLLEHDEVHQHDHQ